MAASEQKSGAGAGQDGDLDSYLEYGRYQALQVWVFGAVLGACEYRAFHLPSVVFSNFDIKYINIHNNIQRRALVRKNLHQEVKILHTDFM